MAPPSIDLWEGQASLIVGRAKRTLRYIGEQKRKPPPAASASRLLGPISSISAIRLRSGSERAFIFRIRWVRCTFTVDSVMPISLAICLFRRPAATWTMISRSRGLSDSKRSLSASQDLVALPAGTIASEAGLDGIEEILIAERLGEKLDGTALHRLHAHRDVAMRRHEDDREWPVRRGQLALKLKPASAPAILRRAPGRSGHPSASALRKSETEENCRVCNPTVRKRRATKSRNSGSSSTTETLGFASRIPGTCVKGSAFFPPEWPDPTHNPKT